MHQELGKGVALFNEKWKEKTGKQNGTALNKADGIVEKHFTECRTAKYYCSENEAILF